MSLSLQDTESTGAAKLRSRRSSHRTRTQNLEKEVELIMSQEDDSDLEAEGWKENHIAVTPKASRKIDPQYQSLSVMKSDTAQTPRRSSRKSIKPVQEYEDIVGGKRQLRSASKVREEHALEVDEVPQAKWTPAKVGRVSQKRSRKSRRADKNKSKLISSSENEDTEHEKDNPNLNSKFEEKVLTRSEIKNVGLNDTMDKNVKSAESINTEKCEAATNLKCKIIDSAENEGMAEDNTGTSRVQTVNESGIEEFATQSRGANIINVEKNATQERCVENSIEDDGMKQNDDFGNYLKNNYFDMSDLGLNPLIDEVFEKEDKETNYESSILEDKHESSFSKASQATILGNTEMAVVAINDDIENMIVKDNGKTSFIKTSESSEVGLLKIPVVTIDDDTLNNSDCMLVNTDAEDDMQPLRFSDDEISTSAPRKAPCIILTTAEGQDKVLNSSTSLNEGATPKRYSKTAERKPTPFKPLYVVSDNEDELDKEVCAADEASVTIAVSKMEPKEIVLHSIRKRSWSVCIGGAEAANIRKNVTFYSPANQTTILEDLNMPIVHTHSLQKNTKEKSNSNETFVTQRRKRSLSFDEALINKSKSRGQTPNKVGVTPQKVKPARTKLPNFAAIHQKNFGKMENIVDHVNRKAERAKILTNSSTKLRLASAQKAAQIQQATNNTDTGTGKSKAVKRINLTTAANSTVSAASKAADTKRKDHNDSKLAAPRIGVCKPLMPTEIRHIENHVANLPNPRLGIIKPNAIASSKNKQPTPAKNVLKPIQIRQVARPAFNLSTALQSSHLNNTKCANTVVGPMTNEASVTKVNVKTTNAVISIDEKMASRRQRHMDMFKGRKANARTTPGTAEKNYGQLIRGVRSNRRFELQMAHRMNMEH